jgi:hypothetical protein
MPCQDCGNGIWECGPNSQHLCKPAGGPTPVVTVCHDVYVAQDDKGKCKGHLDEAPEGDSAKHEFCVRVFVRKDPAGACVVQYKFEPYGRPGASADSESRCEASPPKEGATRRPPTLESR